MFLVSCILLLAEWNRQGWKEILDLAQALEVNIVAREKSDQKQVYDIDLCQGEK